MQDIVNAIRKELEISQDENTRLSGQNFFKEPIKSYGVKMAVVHNIGKKYFKYVKHKPKAEIFNLCEIFWKSELFEESIIACDWSWFLHKTYKPADFTIFENWVANYVNNWASCDTLCNKTIGEFIELYPEYLSRLKEFAHSDNRWMRRASAVTLIVPAKKGKFLNDILEIADILLLDKDDLVRKGYGWMLKAASQSHQKEIFDYVMKKKDIMPRTSLRYAIEKMPKKLKAIAMEK